MWSNQLAQVAQSYADKCIFKHNPDRSEISKYKYVGENLYVTTSRAPDLATIVKAWYDERHDYNYQKNTCSGICGHYTQVGPQGNLKLSTANEDCTSS